ncbi:hypothetical protein [Schnuerera ultunensis]|uniref:Uncharacterized protein n=2 Tax=Schnuerera ultunensis TaxID=45497 RepID=A0A1M4PLN8_9FIRM|nr:hypothetical protein [Schnuerera ultunensis]SHD76377.1 protein of unknown function [[Clostridium] ultunense Esp]
MAFLSYVNIATSGKVVEVSGIDATKQLAIVSAFPLLLIVALMIYLAVKALVKYEDYDVIDNPDTAIVLKN